MSQFARYKLSQINDQQNDRMIESDGSIDKEKLVEKNNVALQRIQQYEQKNLIQNQTLQLCDRKIVSGQRNLNFSSNEIMTASYNRSFLPRIIFVQFQRKYNFYFLIMGFLECIPYLAVNDGIPYIFLPLFILIMFMSIKEYSEDSKRLLTDKEENQQQVQIYDSDLNQFTVCAWKDLHVGDIIKIEENEQSPADVLVINSSNQNLKYYVETNNLDGETNLKVKKVHSKIDRMFAKQQFQQKNVIFECQRANPFFFNSFGIIKGKKTKMFKISYENILLRNCSLRNTNFCIGLVAYTGHDTKVMQNQEIKKKKNSNLNLLTENLLNKIILVLGLLSLFCTIQFTLFMIKVPINNFYSFILESKKINYKIYFGIQFFNWAIILQNIIPISLFCNLEIIRFVQSYLLQNNKKLIKKKQQIIINNSNINEDLGQVKHLFSDKTGTLTCNYMLFKALSVGGDSYGNLSEDDDNYMNNVELIRLPKVSNVDFRDRKLFQVLQNQSDTRYESLVHALFILAQCHQGNVSTKNNEQHLDVHSSDEKALINFAKFVGVEFLGYDEQNRQMIHFNNKTYKYKVLYNLEFNSYRNKQSIIIENEDGEIYLYCKGADSMINKVINKQDSPFFVKILEDNYYYGLQGLRTLLICERHINKSYFKTWMQQFDKAMQLSENRGHQIEELQNIIEQDMVLIGATAIEDKLQPDVDKTIEAFQKANIKVWVLTGDKIDSSVNIAMSCNLISSHMQRFIIEEMDYNSLVQELDSIYDVLTKKSQLNSSNKMQNVLILNGEVMVRMGFGIISEKIFKIIEFCSVVMCCRCSPRQKHDLVNHSICQYPKDIMMAVGDGANDVDMINAAHIGIGIRGADGRHASKNSDISIPEFQVLRSLLFVHGREFCRKNTTHVFFNFYFNTLLLFNQLWYAFYSCFDGVVIVPQNVYNGFAIYTTLPIVLFVLFDSQYSEQLLFENYFNCYQDNIVYSQFNKTFIKWIFNAFFDSLIIFFFSWSSFQEAFTTDRGEQFYYRDLQVFLTFNMILVINSKVLLLTHSFTIMSIFVFCISTTAYFFIPLIDQAHIVRMVTSPICYISTLMIFNFTILISHFFTLFKQLTGRYLLTQLKQLQPRLGMKQIKQWTQKLNFKKRLMKLWVFLLEQGTENKDNYVMRMDDKNNEIKIQMELAENNQIGFITCDSSEI